MCYNNVCLLRNESAHFHIFNFLHASHKRYNSYHKSIRF